MMPPDPASDARLEHALGRPPNAFERIVYRAIRPLMPSRQRHHATPTTSGPSPGADSIGIALPTPARTDLREWFCPTCGARRRIGATTCDACGAAASSLPAARSTQVSVGAAGATAVPRSVRGSGRVRLLVVFGIVALTATVAVVGFASSGTGPALPAPGEPLRPDLVMAPIADVNPSFTGNLVQALRFGAKIANVGDGDLMLTARRSAPWSDDWRVYQQFREPDGRLSERVTDAGVIYGNDTHDHWHVEAVEAHRLERLDTGEVLTEVVKQGFCFYDTDAYRPELSGAPPEAKYMETGCDGQLATRLSVGLSIGWADDYPWQMMDQRMAVGNIPDGIYRLHEIADPFDRFEESDETNNETWVDIELTTSGTFVEVRVVDQAPAR